MRGTQESASPHQKEPASSAELAWVQVTSPDGRTNTKNSNKVRSHVLRRRHKTLAQERVQLKSPRPNYRPLAASSPVLRAVVPPRKPLPKKSAAPKKTPETSPESTPSSSDSEVEIITGEIPIPQEIVHHTGVGYNPRGLHGSWLISSDLQAPKNAAFLISHLFEVLAPNMFDMSDWPNRHRSTLFSLGKSSPAAFHMMLCTAATHIARLHGREYSMQSVKLKSQALAEVNERLSDPSRALADESIESILALSVQEHLFGDLKVWQLHMSGLERIVKLRGGFQNLSLKMQAHIAWIDTNVSCVLDRIPRFPLPENTIPIFNMTVDRPMWAPLQEHGIRKDLLETMEVFQHLTDQIAASSIGKVLESNWLTSKFLDVSNLGARPRLNATLHRLLRRPYDGTESWVLNEVCRLTLLIHFCAAYYTYQKFPPVENPNNVVNLREAILDSGLLVSIDLEGFMLWALFTGAAACIETSTVADWFDDQLCLLCTRLSYNSWEEIESSLEQWFWTGKESRDRYFEVWRRIELNRDDLD